jgi:hypothetical protein
MRLTDRGLPGGRRRRGRPPEPGGARPAGFGIFAGAAREAGCHLAPEVCGRPTRPPRARRAEIGYPGGGASRPGGAGHHWPAVAGPPLGVPPRGHGEHMRNNGFFSPCPPPGRIRAPGRSLAKTAVSAPCAPSRILDRGVGPRPGGSGHGSNPRRRPHGIPPRARPRIGPVFFTTARPPNFPAVVLDHATAAPCAGRGNPKRFSAGRRRLVFRCGRADR